MVDYLLEDVVRLNALFFLLSIYQDWSYRNRFKSFTDGRMDSKKILFNHFDLFTTVFGAETIY